ncbi:MAG: alpha/beta fold hydrolase [Pseudomonadota bacterium]
MQSKLIATLTRLLFLLFSILDAHAASGDGAKPGELPFDFEAPNGEVIAAYQGRFSVPASAQHPAESMSLHYLRFPQIGDSVGSPIVYLAGGPGGSGSATASGRRFELFMALREFGDVIAFDQRGTGQSTQAPRCISDRIVDDQTAYTDAVYVALYRAAADQCLVQWVEQGVRPSDWTTAESVRDLDALRQHLAVDQISLWGISYGSHLALAAIKALDDRIDRVILASVEGLDQTVKQPAQTDAYFARLQAAINQQTALREQYPDLVGLIRGVHAKLEQSPLTVRVQPAEGEAYDFMLERRDMQQFTSMMISDPSRALQLLDLYRALDAGITAPLAGLLAYFHQPNEPIGFWAMNFFMDLASGIEPEAQAQFEQQAAVGLVGAQLNFPMPQLSKLLPELDLGTDFRTPPISDVPVLVLSGTLDGRTYPDSQRAAVSGLSNAQLVTVHNAGHNLFMSSPAVTERILSFMRNQPGPSDITIETWWE